MLAAWHVTPSIKFDDPHQRAEATTDLTGHPRRDRNIARPRLSCAQDLSVRGGPGSCLPHPPPPAHPSSPAGSIPSGSRRRGRWRCSGLRAPGQLDRLPGQRWLRRFPCCKLAVNSWISGCAAGGGQGCHLGQGACRLSTAPVPADLRSMRDCACDSPSGAHRAHPRPARDRARRRTAGGSGCRTSRRRACFRGRSSGSTGRPQAGRRLGSPRRSSRGGVPAQAGWRDRLRPAVPVVRKPVLALSAPPRE
jgi:hypothetical protein